MLVGTAGFDPVLHSRLDEVVRSVHAERNNDIDDYAAVLLGHSPRYDVKPVADELGDKVLRLGGALAGESHDDTHDGRA